MPTFTYSAAGANLQGFLSNGYTLTSPSANSVVLTAGGSLGSAAPSRVEFVYTNRATETATEGPKNGQTVTTAGTLTTVRFFDATTGGNLMLEVTGLSIAATLLDEMLRTSLAPLAWEQIMSSGKNTVVGSTASDIIFSTFGADTVTGGDGNDYIYDMGGRDRYEGGNGYDEVSYEQLFFHPSLGERGMNINMQSGVGASGKGNLDRYISIEQITGTMNGDNFIGSNNADVFIGLGGNDTINGNNGIDTVSYDRDGNGLFGANRGIVANLGATVNSGTVRDGFGGRDRLVNVENLEGSELSDSITGSSVANALGGNGGADTINGAAGNDTLFGDSGNDLLNGGAGSDSLNGGLGSDRFVFTENMGSDVVGDYDDSNDLIAIDIDGKTLSDVVITDSGANVIITVAGVTGQITLLNVDHTIVTANTQDFVLI